MSHITDEERRRSSWNNHSPFLSDSGAPNQAASFQHCNDVFGAIPNQTAPVNPLGYAPQAQPHPQVLPTNFALHPIGNGNFLKVFYTLDNEPPTNFNSYELFSNNSPASPNNRSSGLINGVNNDQSGFHNNGRTTNIINQLVTNWSPNLTGNYLPFGEEASNKAYQQPPVAMEMPSVSPPVPNASNTNGSLEQQPIKPLPEVKKRMVAEVKPMRMSYSDVLSKINSNQSENPGNNLGSTGEPAIIGKATKNGNEKLKASQLPHDRKTLNVEEKEKHENRTSKKVEVEGSGFIAPSNGFQQREKKRSPTHETKESPITVNGKSQKKNAATKTGKDKKTNATNSENGKKQNVSKKRGVDEDAKSGTNKSSLNDKECYYNVAKADATYERPQKIAQQSNNKKSRATYSGISLKGANRFDKSNSNSRRSHQKSTNNRTYELLKILLEKWMEYTIKLLLWLFNLVYDIVVLGCCVGYERLSHYYANSHIYVSFLQREWRNNSGKPVIWLKTTLRKLDNKFKKDSKWAFWRRYFNKKREETKSDSFKQGRLPQTGDEAMSSLLNCKGKDAYSILGVPKDSSQELIRKHYKKIAVLVHPDKNKQAGAEEAFKVLQRAFELIGEPENRKTYDQSLVQALHAEKAWSELNDLLSQLQTKISEAANTIRCSSCGLRHPRKLTDRPHYAARECSFCKIRHSAREGDIWAETTCYGLRWKYLALMEGKVYDITEWVKCQKGALSHLQPNSHVVQYRIVRGQQQQQQQQSNSQSEKEKFKPEQPSEPSLDEFLDNLYSGHNPQNSQSSTKRRARRN